MRSKGTCKIVSIMCFCAVGILSTNSYSQTETSLKTSDIKTDYSSLWLTHLHEARAAYRAGDWKSAAESFSAADTQLPSLLADSQIRIQIRLLHADCLYRLNDKSAANASALGTLRLFGIIDGNVPKPESGFESLTRQCICQSLRTIALSSENLSIDQRIVFAMRAAEFATNNETKLKATVEAAELYLQSASTLLGDFQHHSDLDRGRSLSKSEFLSLLQESISSRAIRTGLLVRTLFVIATLQLAESEYENCFETLQEIRQLPVAAKYQSRLALMHAQIAYRQGEVDSAKKWTEMVEPSGFSNSTRSKFLYLRWQISGVAGMSEREQFAVLQELADLQTKNAHVGFARSKIAAYAATQDDLQRAESYALAALDCPLPKSVKSHAFFTLASLALRQSKWSQAQGYLSGIVTGADSIELRRDIMLVEVQYRLGEWEHLASQIETLLSQIRNSNGSLVSASAPLLKLRLAEIRAHAGQWNEARQISEQLISDTPDFSQSYEAHFVAARACVNTVDFPSALQHLKSVITDARAESTEFADRARWLTGEVHFLSRKWQRAIQAYALIDEHTANRHWLAASKLQTAKCYEYLGQPDKAAELYSDLSVHFPNSPHAKSADSRLTKLRTNAR